MNGWAGLAPPAAPQTPAAPGGGPGRQHPQHPRNAPPCASPPPSGPQFFSVFTKIYEFARKFWGKKPVARCQPGLLRSSGTAHTPPTPAPHSRRLRGSRCPGGGRDEDPSPHRRLPRAARYRHGEAAEPGLGGGIPSEGRPGYSTQPTRRGRITLRTGIRSEPGKGGRSSATWIRFLCLRRSAMLSPSAPPVTWGGGGGGSLARGGGKTAPPQPASRRLSPRGGRCRSLRESRSAASPRRVCALVGSPGGPRLGWAGHPPHHHFGLSGPSCSSLVNQKLPAGEMRPLLLPWPGFTPRCSGSTV